MPVQPGGKLGPYEIVSRLGAGGMGEVWKARDPRLDRPVAIKTSAAQFSDRFEREARAIAALNHPHICQIYDVGPDYLVMEYIDGGPLNGPLPPDQALRYAVQICDALDAAHRKGIVHRDLKPANILITRSSVKLLDFGLAKVQSAVSTGQQTATMALTGQGQIVGTLQYMSPEQIQGGETDARSDIFSFGLVLYEALTGRCAFHGENPASLIAAILKEAPEPLGNLAPLAPPGLERVLARALEKDPERRWQNIRDVMLELEAIRSAPAPVPKAAAPRRPGLAWKTALAMLLAGTVAGAALMIAMRNDGDSTVGKLRLTPVANEAEAEIFPRFSPDGKSIAYERQSGADWELMVRALDARNPVTVATCRGNQCVPLQWSPDSGRIYFLDGRYLMVTGANGGEAHTLRTDVPDWRGTALSPDTRTLIFVRQGADGAPQLVVSSPPQAVPHPMENRLTSKNIFLCRFSPNGHQLAVSSNEGLFIVPYPSGAERRIPMFLPFVAWLPDNRHLAATDRTGSSALVLLDTQSGARRVLLRGSQLIADLSVSEDGRRLVYQGGSSDADVMELSLDTGSLRPLRATGVFETAPDYAPDGKRFVYVDSASGASEIVVRDIDGSRPVQLTSGNQDTVINVFRSRNRPRFSHDGRRIAFTWSGRVWTIPAEGGQPVAVSPEGDQPDAVAWSPDDRSLVYTRGTGQRTLARIDSTGQGQPVQICGKGWLSAYETPQWSARGEIAYSGVGGIHACLEDGSGDRLLAPGATSGAFNRTGDLFYMPRLDGKQWRIQTLEVASGKVVASRDVAIPSGALVAQLSLHPDGKRIAFTMHQNLHDLWMLDGIPRPATGWRALFHHWSE